MYYFLASHCRPYPLAISDYQCADPAKRLLSSSAAPVAKGPILDSIPRFGDDVAVSAQAVRTWTSPSG
jgi:hypothetical protein